MINIKTISLSLLVTLNLSLSSYGEKLYHPYKNNVKGAYSLNKYSELKKIPDIFYWHDPEQIFKALENFNQNKQKSEFESKEKYKNRISKFENSKILGELTLNDHFLAHLYFYKPEKQMVYDAETSQLHIYVPTRERPNISNKCITSKSIILNEKYMARSKYYKNKKVEVMVTNTNEYNIEILNKNIFSDLFQEYVHITLNMDNEIAKKVKYEYSNDLDIFAILEIDKSNPISYGKYDSSPATLDDPVEFHDNYKYIRANIKGFLVYADKYLVGTQYLNIESNNNTE